MKPLFHNHDGVALITLDQPPVNALCLALRLHLGAALQAALSDEAVRALVIIGSPRGFSAGGDIGEFDLPATWQEPTPMSLFRLIEDSPKPVVAALHGMALGGGLELAMACHARVAQRETRVGLPEVHLGLLPGAGGTQRLPRLVGAELALNMIVQGRTCSAASLGESGLFDRLTDESPLAAALALADELSQGQALRRTCQLAVELPNAQAFFAFARASVQARARGLPAPTACVDCVEYACTLPFAEGLEREREQFARLRASPQSAALRHAFLAERKATEIRGLPASGESREIARAVVVGAGTMGSGIAIALANAGLPVTLIEQQQAALERGLDSIRQHYQGALDKGRLTAQQFEQRLALIEGALDFAAVAQADLVIEAVFEDLEVKRQVFERLDQLARPGTLLASNTSMLDLDRIAAFTSRPQDVLGLHFFSPAQVMPLLEVVRGAKTAPAVLASAMALARRLNKTAVVSGVCEGFIGNRMLQPYLMQVGMLLDEGALPQQIDQAMETWGMAMGPLRMCDTAGNDLGAKIQAQRMAHDPTLVYSRSFARVAEMGRAGQKVGRGWYDYLPGQRKPLPSAEVNDAIVAESQRLGLTRRSIGDVEIVERLLLALVNEGAKILEEGIAQRASDIDVVYLAGYGFPRWRGGPMFCAEQRGLADVLASLQHLAGNGPAYQRRAEFWRPAELIRRLVDNDQDFASLTDSELS